MNIDTAIERLGDAALWRELVAIYLRTTRTRIASLNAAVEEGAVDTLRVHAHALKGSSAVLSAETMRALSAQLEDLSGDQTKKGAILVERLGEEFARLEGQVADLPDAPMIGEI